MKRILLSLLLLGTLSCGEDRSGEQPFAPKVATREAVWLNGQAVLSGAVLSSPNSRLQVCGFIYGTQPHQLTHNIIAPDTAFSFTATTPPLAAGKYYYAAYARNGIGTAHGDTLSLLVP